jgi:fatty acid desaturase
MASEGRRDYSLTGADARRAVETGLASAEWYHTEVARKQMKELMQRSDGPALRDTAIWLGAMAVFAGLGIFFWGSWIALPFFLAYGVLYGSGGDSRWHECGHGTAFRTPWMNQAVYQIACFMMMRNPVTWRWSHVRHHTDTVIVGRDPEISVMRPPDLLRVCLNFFGILDAWHAMGDTVRNAFGHISAGERTFIPESEYGSLMRIARIWLAIYVAVIGLTIVLHSILPLVVIGLPRLYGAWHHVLTGLLQHGGLADNVIDHRLNSRTVLMNPVSRFIYWNMNYHVEHHMFPMVPYHALPRLHALIKDDVPPANPSMVHGYREMLPAFLRQLRNEDYFLKRALPATARPYREELHAPPMPQAAE